MEGGGEKCVWDTRHLRLVHQQDGATLGVESPLAPEDFVLSARGVSVIP
jgi:hypothetical protein